MKTETFEITMEQEGERLDKYLSMIYPDISRSFFHNRLSPFVDYSKIIL